MEFPEVTPHAALNKKAWRTSAKHYLKITYWDYLSDSIINCEVLLKKDEPFSKINQFVSYIGNLCEHPNSEKWKMTPPATAKPGLSRGLARGKSPASSSSTSSKSMKRMLKSGPIFCLGKVFCAPCTMLVVNGVSPSCCVPWVCCPCAWCYTCCCWWPKM